MRFNRTLCSLTLFACFLIETIGKQVEYRTNEEVERLLSFYNTVKVVGVRTSLYSIGKSTQNRNLTVFTITAAKVGQIGVPNVKFVATIHGNELIGREMLLLFIKDLLDQYGKDRNITYLLNNTIIHILPTLNPDSSSNLNSIKRENFQRIDLNRDYPKYYRKNGYANKSIEVRAVMQWLNNINFVLSAGLFEGAFHVSYPFDDINKASTGLATKYSKTPDDDIFRHIAAVYATNHHKNMSIINGGEWKLTSGSMQDYNYAFGGCMEVSIILTDFRYAPASITTEIWAEHRKAFVKFALEANRGITGRILDRHTTKPIQKASLWIRGREFRFLSAKNGEFWRILLPGTYTIDVEADGYYPKSVSFTFADQGNPPKAHFLAILLTNSSILTTAEPKSTTLASTQRPRTPDEVEIDDLLLQFENKIDTPHFEVRPEFRTLVQLNSASICIKQNLFCCFSIVYILNIMYKFY